MGCIRLRTWLPFVTFVLLRAVWCFDLAQAAGGRITFRDNDDLAKSATWQMPTEASLALSFSDWLANIEAPPNYPREDHGSPSHRARGG